MNIKLSNCPPREQLFAYTAKMLGPEEELAAKLHVAECACCRHFVEDYRGVDNVLDEWKAPEPSPGFDVCLRDAIEQTQSRTWVGGSREGVRARLDRWLDWTHGTPSRVHWLVPALALAVVISSAVVFIRVRGQGVSHRASGHSASVGAPDRGKATTGSPAAGEIARYGLQTGSGPNVEGGPSPQDDEMLANFDVLSELPAPQKRAQQTDN